MIGSSTLVVRKSGILYAHTCGLPMDYLIRKACDERKTTPFDLIKAAEANWGSPNANDLSEDDINRLLVGECSNRWHNEKHGNSPCLAGDIVMLLDLDESKLYRASRNRGAWIPFEFEVYE